MSLYEQTIPQYGKMLRNLDRWLDKAVAYASERKFDPAVLLEARLAPDQFSLLRQIQNACDNAKFGASRLSGRESPQQPDTEQTLDEIRARIQTVLAYLETVKPEDLQGAETRKVTLPFLPGVFVTGADYVTEWALPNFYFHVTTAYAILRHNGVPVGKKDFIGGLKTQPLG